MSKTTKTLQLSHISFQCLARTLLRNCWMIITAALVFAMGTSLFLTWFHVPQYQATMTYAVTAKTTSYTSSGNLTSTREVASVLSELLGTELINEGIRTTDPRLASFDGTITASQVGESNLIVVTASAPTPQTALLALDALIDVFPNVADYISNRSVLNILRNPTVSPIPSNQINISKSAQTAAIVGALLMAAVLCYVSIQGETIQTRTGARQLLDAPILASICHERKNRTLKTAMKGTNKQVQVFAPTTSFAYTEQISAVCGQLEHEAVARNRKVFLITGVGESEGKSTVAGNIAATLALKGHKVALVDCDLRKPVMNKFFDNQYNSPMPLNKLLARPYSRENMLQCIVCHEQLGLYMLFPSGSDARSAELVSSDTMVTLVEQLRAFDYVIIDSPPMGMFPDAETLAELVDASMLVVRQDYTAACDINDSIDTLRQCKSAFLGCILNDMLGSLRSHYGYGYGSKYGYGSRYGYGGKYGYGSHSSSRHKSGSKES